MKNSKNLFSVPCLPGVLDRLRVGISAHIHKSMGSLNEKRGVQQTG